MSVVSILTLKRKNSVTEGFFAINRNLEQVARQLYGYWFVQFDFPNEEGQPYKSSGGEMVWNDALKREIPFDWQVKKLSELANTYSGGTPQSNNPSYYADGNIAWINSGELNEPFITATTNYITELGLQNSSAKMYPANSIIIALYGATAGKVSFLSFEACSNQAVCGIMPKDNKYTQYLRLYVSSLYDYFVRVSSGSARDNISQDTVKNTLIPCPSENTLIKFASATDAFCNNIVENLREINRLQQLRDELLPMLLNGQLSVNDIKSYDFMPQDMPMAAEP